MFSKIRYIFIKKDGIFPIFFSCYVILVMNKTGEDNYIDEKMGDIYLENPLNEETPVLTEDEVSQILSEAGYAREQMVIEYTPDGIPITPENKFDEDIYDYLYHYWKEHSGEYDPKGNVAAANHISLKYKTENELKFEKWAMREFGMTNEEQTEHTLPGLLSSVLEISNAIDVILLPVSLFSAGAKFVGKEALKEGGEELAEAAGKQLLKMEGKEALQEAATKELEKEALKALFKKAAIENLEKSAKSLAKETKEKLIKVTEGFVEKYFDKWLSWNRSLAVTAEGGRVQAQYMMKDTAKNAVKKEVAGEAVEKTGKEVAEETTEKLSKETVEKATDDTAKTAIGVKDGNNTQWPSAKELYGKDFENYLTENIGGNGSFSKGGRDFDGGIGNRWWEAKSGPFWENRVNDLKAIEKFKSDMGDRLRIAQENGATYELFSNTPIPQVFKDYLIKKGIPFTEILN